MALPMQPSASDGVWMRTPASNPLNNGPIPLGGGNPAALPTVNNPNLPTNRMPPFGNLSPPIPQALGSPFGLAQPPFGPANSLNSNIYGTANTAPSYNPIPTNPVPNPPLAVQNDANQRRLMQLEDESAQRRATTSNLQQLGTQLLQGQMDVQEQVLQYQYMLEQCMEALDQQNYVLNEQAEEIALLRAKMRHFEYLMDALKMSREGNRLLNSMSGDLNAMENNLLCCRDPVALQPPSTSPFFTGGPTRATASTFQPFNPRYRSPNSRAATASTLNGRRSVTPVQNNANFPTSANRPTRRYGYGAVK